MEAENWKERAMPATKPIEGTCPSVMHVARVARTTGQGLEMEYSTLPPALMVMAMRSALVALSVTTSHTHGAPKAASNEAAVGSAPPAASRPAA